ncbi:UNVERIFIED_CONTAM: hypothetical protein K2H54_037761 [Gekko kuhli]
MQWSQFDMQSTQETYLLTQGPRRESLFDSELFLGLVGQAAGPSRVGGASASRAWIMERSKERKDYLLTKGNEEKDGVNQRLDALERTQGKFCWDLEEVIRAIPDMVAPGVRSPYPGKLRSKPSRVVEGTKEQRMKQGLCLK